MRISAFCYISFFCGVSMSDECFLFPEQQNSEKLGGWFKTFSKNLFQNQKAYWDVHGT